MHKICAREVKTTGMETAGNQWGGTNFRKRFINFKKMLAISKKYGIIIHIVRLGGKSDGKNIICGF